MLEAFFRKQLAVFLILDIRCTFLKQEMATNAFVFLNPPPKKNPNLVLEDFQYVFLQLGYNHNPDIFSFVTFHRVCKNSNITVRGSGTAYPSRTYEFTPSFSGVYVAQSVVFCIVLGGLLSLFCWLLYCLSFFDLRILIIPCSIFKYFCSVLKETGQLKVIKSHSSPILRPE